MTGERFATHAHEKVSYINLSETEKCTRNLAEINTLETKRTRGRRDTMTRRGERRRAGDPIRLDGEGQLRW